MKEDREYIRLTWPDYQSLMEEHSSEWTEVASFGGTDVLVPKKWVIEQRVKIRKEKKSKIEIELKEYFKGTYIKEFRLNDYTNMIGEDCIEIFSLDPYFDEDYDGKFDDDIDKIGEKYNIPLSFDSGSYGK
jgi:hypothetical protein